MSIKSDKWIQTMSLEKEMIKPFEPKQIRRANDQKIISYGTSSYGYDVRCSTEFKIFTNINSNIVDPKNFNEKSFVEVTLMNASFLPIHLPLQVLLSISRYHAQPLSFVLENQPMQGAESLSMSPRLNLNGKAM